MVEGGLKMKILVTGGAGFIGSHISDYFIENGYEVVIVDSLIHGNREFINPSAVFYEMDITDPDLIKVFEKEKPDYVSHHAAQIKVLNSVTDPIMDAQINIIGSINILECCRKTNVKKIIYPSSAAIFGNPMYLPIDEAHPLNMISGYGVSKHTVEHYLEVYNKLYGLEYTSFRYANVYGPRQDSTGEGGVISIFAEQFEKGITPTIFGDGEQTRDFVYVKDIARANYFAINEGLTGLYNVSSNIATSVNDLIDIFNRVYGKNIKPIYEQERPGDIKHSYMSYDKINKACGWAPTYSIEEGITKMKK